MSDPLGDRLDHALRHLDSLDSQASTFFAGKPYGLVREDDPDGLNYRWRVDIKRAVTPEIGFVASDCVHALRSTLDNLAWEAAMTATKGNAFDRTSFVIAKSCQGFDDKRWQLQSLPKKAVDFIESKQPYRRAKDAESDTMWVLERLWNDDKHRAPLVVGGIAGLHEVHHGGLHMPPDSEIRWVLNFGAFNDGDVLVEAVFAPGSYFKEYMEPEPTFAIAFEKEGPGRGRPVGPTLRALYDEIRDDFIPGLRVLV